jgi:hypothetical protein
MNKGRFRFMYRSRLHGLRWLWPAALLATSAAGAACTAIAPEPEPGGGAAAEPLGSDESAVYGDLGYADSCNEPGVHTQLAKSIRWGRVASASAAYNECVQRAFRGTVTYAGWTIGPYRQCVGDPFYGASLDTQIDRALDAMRSPNDWLIHCDGTVGNGSASLGHYSDTDAEDMAFSYQAKANYDSLSLPLCTATNPPTDGTTDTDGNGHDDRGCRWRPAPWPWSADAGTGWHEAAHQHGYTHGANDQANAKVSCGYAGDATWNYQVNTAPYILGQCVANVLNESAATCGSLDTGCYGGALRMVTRLGGTTCECVEDPADDRYGVIGLSSHGLDDLAMVGTGDNVNGGGLVTPGSDVLRTGDLDGDGRSELVLATDNAWEVEQIHPVGQTLWRKDSLSYGVATGSWTLQKAHSLAAVADLDGNGRDDLVVKSSTKLGVLYRNNSTATYGTLNVLTFGTHVGTWPLAASDTIVGVGDFNGDGKDDLLVRNDTAFAILTRTAGGTITTLHEIDQGTWMGGWFFHGSNRIFGIADYNGDGRADFIVRSTWGLAIIGRNTSGALVPLQMWQNGTVVAGWTLDDGDTLSSFGDYDGDGRKDFLVRNDASLAILRMTGTPASLSSYRKVAFRTWAGGWFLRPEDSFGFALDSDGDHKDEVVVKSTWGRGLLKASSTGFVSVALTPFGGLMGSWPLHDGDLVRAVGDFLGDGHEQLVIQR